MSNLTPRYESFCPVRAEGLNEAFKRHGLPLEVIPNVDGYPVLCGLVVGLLDYTDELEERIEKLEALLCP